MKTIVGVATDDHVSARNVMETRSHIKDWQCYEEALDTVEQLCGNHLNIPEVCCRHNTPFLMLFQMFQALCFSYYGFCRKNFL